MTALLSLLVPLIVNDLGGTRQMKIDSLSEPITVMALSASISDRYHLLHPMTAITRTIKALTYDGEAGRRSYRLLHRCWPDLALIFSFVFELSVLNS